LNAPLPSSYKVVSALALNTAVTPRDGAISSRNILNQISVSSKVFEQRPYLTKQQKQT
jgi:hypothetical protein